MWAIASSGLMRLWSLPIRAPPVRSYIHIADPSARDSLRGITPTLAEHGQQEGQHLHQVGRVAAQPLALGQGLVDQADVALLEVAQPAVDHLGGLRRGAGGEVVALHQARCAGLARRHRGRCPSRSRHHRSPARRSGCRPVVAGRRLDRRHRAWTARFRDRGRLRDRRGRGGRRRSGYVGIVTSASVGAVHPGHVMSRCAVLVGRAAVRWATDLADPDNNRCRLPLGWVP